MTVPAVPPPGHIRTPIDVMLKRGWTFEPAARVFRSPVRETFSVRGQLPKGTRIVHKVPRLAGADAARLSAAERELQRYLQIILPHGESPATYLHQVRAWPAVESAHAGPEISLPRP